jgi:hypothetical protein
MHDAISCVFLNPYSRLFLVCVCSLLYFSLVTLDRENLLVPFCVYAN